MPRGRQRVNFSTFSAGKVSDSSPLNPVENAARVLLNVDLELNGKIGRRLGLEPEDNFNFPVDVNNDSDAWLAGYTLDEIQDLGIDFYSWENVDESPGESYLVTRIGNTLYVYDQKGSALSNTLIRTVDISSFSTVAAEQAATDGLQATVVKGVLVLTGNRYNPFYIRHNIVTNTWTVEQVNIQIRDLVGVDDGLDVDERPVTLSDSHKYNLLNQGWVAVADWSVPKGYNRFKVGSGNYPSNADIIHYGNTVSSNGFPTWDFNFVKRGDTGTTPAPKGRFIIDPFDPVSRQTISGIGGLDQEEESLFRPKAIATFSGRVWYASRSGVIFYSKIIEDLEDLGKCYQEQDPTAEDFNEVIDTDGGTIKILDVGEVIGLGAIGKALIVFGSKGIWAISGGDVGFTANAQFIDNISKVSVAGYRTIVEAGDAIYFWSHEGLYMVSIDQQISVVNLSKGRIDKDFRRIPSAAKAYAQGMYDRVQQRVYWAYSLHTSDSSSDIRHKYTDVLVYSSLLNAFWDYRLTNEGFSEASDNYPIMCGLISKPLETILSTEDDVFVRSVAVSLDSINGARYTYNLTWESGTVDYLPSNVSSTIREGLNFFEIEGSTYALVGLTVTEGVSGSDDVEIPPQKFVTQNGIDWVESECTYTGEGTYTDSVRSPATNIARNSSSGRLVYIDYGSSLGVADKGNSWYSDDEGDSWNIGGDVFSFDSGAVETIGGVDYPTYMEHLVYDSVSNRFVAFPLLWNSSDPYILYSSDGISWTSLDLSSKLDGSLPDTVDLSDGYLIRDIKFDVDTNTYIFIGDRGAISPYNVLRGYMVGYDGSPKYVVEASGAFSPASFDAPTNIEYHSGRGEYFFNSYLTSSSTLNKFITSSREFTTDVATDAGYHMGYFFYIPKISMMFASNSSTSFGTVSTDGVTWLPVTNNIEGTEPFIAFDVATEVVEQDGESVYIEIPVSSFIDSQSTLTAAMLLPDSEGDVRLTFGQFSSRSFNDWASLEQADIEANDNYAVGFPVSAVVSGDYKSVIETLPQTLGEPSLQKQGTYIFTYFDYLRNGYGELEIPDEFDSE